ncbi:hypothetical protein QZH41_016856, partial [Actinostola sp. cb2023]
DRSISTVFCKCSLTMSRRKIGNIYCAVDVICFGIVGMVNLLLHVTDIQPAKRGFHCNDESLNFPYKHETISTVAALFSGLGLGVVTIVVCETLRHFVFKFKPRGAGRDDYYLKCGPLILKAWQRRIAFLIFMFGFGMVVTNLFTDVGKLLIGRLRPYFLSVCIPDLSKVNCSAGEFVTDDICTGDKKQIMEARIFDYWHHWGDVLTGMAIGTIVATFTVFKPLSLFSSNTGVSYERESRSLDEVESQIDAKRSTNAESPDIQTVEDPKNF